MCVREFVKVGELNLSMFVTWCFVHPYLATAVVLATVAAVAVLAQTALGPLAAAAEPVDPEVTVRRSLLEARAEHCRRRLSAFPDLVPGEEPGWRRGFLEGRLRAYEELLAEDGRR